MCHSLASNPSHSLMYVPGQISITLESDWKEPKDPNSDLDVAAATRAMEFKLGKSFHSYVKRHCPVSTPITCIGSSCA